MMNRPPHNRAHIPLRVFVLAGLILALLVVSLQVVNAQAGVITGIVYRDYDNNGARGAAEPGVGGAIITGYNDAGTPIGTTTSSSDPATLGQYTLPVVASGTLVRIEFTPPAPFRTAVFGGNSPTSVQFVPVGGSADFGVQAPGDVCNNPRIVTSCFIPGDNSTNTTRAVASWDYFANGRVGEYAETTIATANEVGTVYGLAFQSSTQTLFEASYVRRGTGQGPSNSTGTIYRMSPTGGASIFLELNGLAGIDTGANPHPNGMAASWLQDPGGFAAPGKVGLGDMDISTDETTLYVMNLFQREVLVLPLGLSGGAPTPPAGGSIIRRPVPTPANCPAADVRPFALKYYNNTLYVGMVCTGESTLQQIFATNPTPTLADIQPAKNMLRAYVYRFNPASNTFDGAPALEFPLTYPRGAINFFFTGIDPNNDGEWLPWTDVWLPSYAPFSTAQTPPNIGNPQAMLTDIEFDDSGLMLLGFRDRFGDQGFSQMDISPTDGPATYDAYQAGDLLIACQNGGAWQIENNGQCLGRGPSAGAGNNEGPSGGEFFYNENFVPYHGEIALGGLGVLPGRNEVVTTVFDAWDTFENGTHTYNVQTAALVRRTQMFAPGTLLRKGAGMGDIEFVCDAAPIEIGNRVWRDDDRNGVQDPNEVPLAGVTVQLFSPAGALLGTAITDVDGGYYFSSGPGTNTISAIYNIAGLTFNTAGFEVRIDVTQVALTGLFLTIPNNDGSPDGDFRDSDGILQGTIAVATFNTGGPGDNNHTYDFGFNNSQVPVTPTTPTTPPVTPGTPGPAATPGSGGGPASQPGGPTLSKIVDRPFALPGETITWTVVVSNPNAYDLANITVTDSVPGELIILSASSSAGTVSVNGQTVTLTLATLPANSTVTITIVTRVRDGVAGVAVENVAVLGDLRASATAIIITGLPRTGETPWWRLPLLLGMGSSVVAGYALWRRQRASSQP